WLLLLHIRGLGQPEDDFVNRAFEKFDRAAVLGRCAVEPEAMIGCAEIGARDHVAPDRRVGDEHLPPVRSLLPDHGLLACVTHCCSTLGDCGARPSASLTRSSSSGLYLLAAPSTVSAPRVQGNDEGAMTIPHRAPAELMAGVDWAIDGALLDVNGQPQHCRTDVDATLLA